MNQSHNPSKRPILYDWSKEEDFVEVNKQDSPSKNDPKKSIDDSNVIPINREQAEIIQLPNSHPSINDDQPMKMLAKANQKSVLEFLPVDESLLEIDRKDRLRRRLKFQTRLAGGTLAVWATYQTLGTIN